MNQKPIIELSESISIKMVLESFSSGDKTGTLCLDNLPIVDGDVCYEINLNNKYPYINLQYTYDGSSGSRSYTNYDCKINLWGTHCYFGGYRYLFLCPNCFRRVLTIYFYETRFLCRHCHNLKYISQLLTKRSRWHPELREIALERKIKKIEKLLPRSARWRGKETKRRKRYENLKDDLYITRREKQLRWT